MKDYHQQNSRAKSTVFKKLKSAKKNLITSYKLQFVIPYPTLLKFNSGHWYLPPAELCHITVDFLWETHFLRIPATFWFPELIVNQSSFYFHLNLEQGNAFHNFEIDLQIGPFWFRRGGWQMQRGWIEIIAYSRLQKRVYRAAFLFL